MKEPFAPEFSTYSSNSSGVNSGLNSLVTSSVYESDLIFLKLVFNTLHTNNQYLDIIISKLLIEWS